MFIIRNNKKIILTSDELEQAYREQKHNYLLGDAEDQFSDFISVRFKEEGSFNKCFGFSEEDVCDRDSAYYLLEKFVAAYEKHHDCNNAENDVWEETIRNILIENARNVKRTYRAEYALWDVRDPASWRKITVLYSPMYDTIEKLYAEAPAYIAASLERHGVRNGKVCISSSIKEVKTIGDDCHNGYQDTIIVQHPKQSYVTIVDGKLVFDDADGKEG